MADREKLIELVDKARRYAARKCHSFMSCAECSHYGEHDGNCRNAYITESLIANGVTVRERGRWISVGELDEDGNGQYHCSVCSAGEKHNPIVDVPYCWKCGADMRPMEEANV